MFGAVIFGKIARPSSLRWGAPAGLQVGDGPSGRSAGLFWGAAGREGRMLGSALLWQNTLPPLLRGQHPARVPSPAQPPPGTAVPA